HLAEELDVVGGAHMLEHADRNDAIVLVGLLTIIEELEPHTIGEAAFQRAAAGDGELLLRQRHTGNIDAELLAQEKRHAAPTRSDIKDILAGLQQQLGSDMALLVELGLLERLLAGLEIGAGILPVAIEEEVVELVLEVVVMGDI